MSEDGMTTGELLRVALDTVRAAAEMALHPVGSLDIHTKANRNDLVTAVDQGIEAFVAQRLEAETGYPLLGEEGHTVSSFRGRIWVLDPIDGTMNFVATHRDYAISLALCEDGLPVIAVIADVVAGHFYTATRGGGVSCDGAQLPVVLDEGGYRESIIITDLKEILALPRLAACLTESRGHRRYGSAALECTEVACGRAGAFVHMWVSPWDIAAAVLICEESGIKVTRLDGTPMDVRHKGSVLAAPPTIHEELLHKLMVDAS